MLRAIRRYMLSIFLIALAATASGVFLYNESSSQALATAKLVEQRRLDGERSLAAALERRRIIEFKKARSAAAAEILDITSAARQNGKTATLPKNLEPVCTVDDSSSIKVVVNKKNCLKPLNFQPDDLTYVNNVQVRGAMANDLADMLTAASSAGNSLTITSGFRSYYDQVTIYNSYVASLGSTGLADGFASRPSYSEHQTGLAIDLKSGGCALDCFGRTSAYKWLRDNAHTYGFIERYTSDKTSITGYGAEPWHWRYVGSTIANDMKKKGVKTLEEYYDIEGGLYD
ncbi:MAG: M15 family metallopeptidase [Candidatus Saccharimonadaceae bacterium]